MTLADVLTVEDFLKNTPEEGIDLENPGRYQTLLQDLQAGILTANERNFSTHLFLKFKDGQIDTVKEWIQNFALTYLKSAMQKSDEAVMNSAESSSGSLVANFFLSRVGYEYLNFPSAKIPQDEAFRLGMKNESIAQELGDPAVKEWQPEFQNNIHALVTLGDNNENNLQVNVHTIKEELSQLAEIVQQDDGFILKNQAGQTIEHFGFVDGISQPLFLKRDIDKARQESDFSKWNPVASLNLVLVRDPNGQTEDSYGSYLVYRKLEQDVQGWDKDVESLATTLKVKADLAGALIIGRFQDGTPVTLSNEAAKVLTDNFNYDLDEKGTKCPFHAHIRKMNPRGDTGRVVSSPDFEQSLNSEKDHRIARRSMSYGEKDLQKEPKPSQGSGMLFLCFQADIKNQFNFMQSAWANEKNFVQVNVGRDTVIGQGESSQKWPDKWGEPTTIDYSFKQWVTMKGGEYFFAPSISFLKKIS